MSVVAQSISFFGATSSHLLTSAAPSNRRSAPNLPSCGLLSCANAGEIKNAVAAHAHAVASTSRFISSSRARSSACEASFWQVCSSLDAFAVQRERCAWPASRPSPGSQRTMRAPRSPARRADEVPVSIRRCTRRPALRFGVSAKAWRERAGVSRPRGWRCVL